MKTWHAVDVTVPSSAVEAVEHAFNILDSEGTEVEDFRKKDTQSVCVVGYFEKPPQEKSVTTALHEALRVYGLASNTIIDVQSRSVPEADWLAEWKKHWQPTTIGRFVIAPPWAEVDDSDQIVIRIEPNVAFGTGTHETTQLCLRAIDKNFREGMSFFDVSTGTGILAIAVAKLAMSSRITACDVDEDSIKIARENAQVNGVGGKIEFFQGSIDETTPAFDLVCANLTLDVITLLLPLLLAKTYKLLLISGILVEQEKDIARELSKFAISSFKFSYAGEWLSVLISK